MRIGLNGGGGHTHIDTAIAHAREAEQEGFASFWLSQVFGLDSITALALISREVPRIDLGVAVVPTYARHPFALALQVQTAQQVAAGRLVLGIGPSHAPVVEMMWGLDFSKPYSHTAEYLDILRGLLDGEEVHHAGKQLTAHGQLSAEAPRTPIIVAGLGPRMLRLAGEKADGTATWMCGPKTLEEHIIPGVKAAAEKAGRPSPRIIAGLPICVTDDAERARSFAAEKLAVYARLPSYQAMIAREGGKEPADICLIGNEATVSEGLARLAAIGVTDLRATELDPTPEEKARTRAVLRAQLEGLA